MRVCRYLSAALLVTSMGVGFSSVAHAMCPITGGTCKPFPVSSTVENTTYSGMADPSTETINAYTYLANSSGTLPNTITAGNNTAEVWLPHSYVQAHRYVSNGAPYLTIYISTKSAYAPNGDSGTFVFDSSGTLISGSASALSRIQAEVLNADPQTMSIVGGLVSWFENNAAQIQACGEFALGAVTVAAGIAGGVATGGAVGLLIGGAGLDGGADLMVHTATKCF